MIEIALLNLLLADVSLSSWLNDQMFIQVKDNQSRGDYLVINEISFVQPVNVQREKGIKQSVIQFDVYCRDVLKIRLIKQHLIDLFNGAEHALPGVDVQLALMQSARPNYDAKHKIFSYSVDIKFHYH